jgi:AcrR family transcriptional regulator
MTKYQKRFLEAAAKKGLVRLKFNDISEKAEVSKSTIYNVFTGENDVSDKVRKRVEKVVGLK